MGIPPKHKDLTSDIISFIKLLARLALAGILVSVGLPALFLLLHVLSWPPSTKKDTEVKQNIGLINRVQDSYLLENGVFANTFDELATGIFQGRNIAKSPNFLYELDIKSKDLATISAKPIDENNHGYNGAVLRYKNKKGFLATKSIVCESVGTGVNGANSDNSPAVNTLGNLTCAPNWKILYENNNREPSDLELAELIQGKAKDEIGRVLREQNSIYYKQGEFIDRYSDIPQEKNRSSPKFNVKIRSHIDRAIVAIQNESSEQDKSKTSFGLIKLVRSKQAQPLSDSSQEKNKILWHYLYTISFLCTSNQTGTALPKNRDLDRVIDRCPTGYTKSSVIEHEYDLAKDNLVTIRMTQEAYYQRHNRFITDFAEFEKFTIETSRRYSSLIKVKQDPYQYDFQVNGKILFITAQPKYFTNPLSNVTYLRISSATGTDKNWPFVHTFCESKIKNIPIPTNVHYTGSCPAGYYLLKRGFF
jgi:type II secretory pathway pseudopilin PulG